MKVFNDLFGDGVFVINKDSDVGRLSQFRNGFPDLKFERFPAVVPNLERKMSQIIGNRSSHLEIIKLSKSLGLKRVMVFEDDSYVVDKRAGLSLVGASDFIKTKEWAIFYFGGRHALQPDFVEQNVRKVKRVIATHAIAYSNNYYDKLIEIMTVPNSDNRPIDVILGGAIRCKSSFLTENPCYSVYPAFVLQKTNRNVVGDLVDSSYWVERF